MIEQKPGEQYTAIPREVTPILPSGNGEKPTEPTIDDESKRFAMAQAAMENQLRQREAQCEAEIGEILQSIGRKFRCDIRIMETRDIAADRVASVYIKAIAAERIPPQQARG
jgi:hypothetical protein